MSAQLFLCCNNATLTAADQYDQVVPGCCGSVRFLHMLLRSQVPTPVCLVSSDFNHPIQQTNPTNSRINCLASVSWSQPTYSTLLNNGFYLQMWHRLRLSSSIRYYFLLRYFLRGQIQTVPVKIGICIFYHRAKAPEQTCLLTYQSTTSEEYGQQIRL